MIKFSWGKLYFSIHKRLLKNEGVTFVFVSIGEFSEFENRFRTVDKPVDKLWRLTMGTEVQNKAHTENDKKNKAKKELEEISIKVTHTLKYRSLSLRVIIVIPSLAKVTPSPNPTLVIHKQKHPLRGVFVI